jgi:DNA-binding HxlR family transcriptional regulator
MGDHARMKLQTFDALNCSVARALEQVGEWWTLLIVREAFLGVQRFSEFEQRLGISRNILSERLSKLVEVGILERQKVVGRGNPQNYKLTRKGLDLFPVIVALLQWGDKWINHEQGAPVILLERESGSEIAPIQLMSRTGVPLRLSRLVIEAGPGADETILARVSQTAAQTDHASGVATATTRTGKVAAKPTESRRVR